MVPVRADGCVGEPAAGASLRGADGDTRTGRWWSGPESQLRDAPAPRHQRGRSSTATPSTSRRRPRCSSPDPLVRSNHPRSRSGARCQLPEGRRDRRARREAALRHRRHPRRRSASRRSTAPRSSPLGRAPRPPARRARRRPAGACSRRATPATRRRRSGRLARRRACAAAGVAVPLRAWSPTAGGRRLVRDAGRRRPTAWRSRPATTRRPTTASSSSAATATSWRDAHEAELERRIERLLAEAASRVSDPRAATERSTPRWRPSIGDVSRPTLDRRAAAAAMRIALDLANGAAFRVAPESSPAAGAEVVRCRDQPGRPQHQPRLWLDAARGAGRAGGRRIGARPRAWPSTATPTASSRSTSRRRCATATPSSSLWAPRCCTAAANSSRRRSSPPR